MAMTGWRASGSRYQLSAALPILQELVAAAIARRVAAPVPSLPKTWVLETNPTITSGPCEGAASANDTPAAAANKAPRRTELAEKSIGCLPCMTHVDRRQRSTKAAKEYWTPLARFFQVALPGLMCHPSI